MSDYLYKSDIERTSTDSVSGPTLLTDLQDAMTLLDRPRQLPLALPTSLASAGDAADHAAAAHVFDRFRARLADETRRRHDADLACLATFLTAAGLTPGDLVSDPLVWAGMTWGLAEAFLAWQLQQGYAVGSINVRLSTLKTYAKLATQAGVLTPDAYALIRAVRSFRHAEGRRIDAQRETTRTGNKKAEPIPLSRDQAGQLKVTGDARQQLVMALLLDHGLRVGEVAIIEVRHFDLDRGVLQFYRPKVHKQQQHRLSRDALAAASSYLPTAPATGPIFPGTRQLARLVATAGAAIGVAGLSPHDCRHAWATFATRAGTPIKALQDAGGWSSPAMPLRYAESAQIANDGVRLD